MNSNINKRYRYPTAAIAAAIRDRIAEVGPNADRALERLSAPPTTFAGHRFVLKGCAVDAYMAAHGLPSRGAIVWDHAPQQEVNARARARLLQHVLFCDGRVPPLGGLETRISVTGGPSDVPPDTVKAEILAKTAERIPQLGTPDYLVSPASGADDLVMSIRNYDRTAFRPARSSLGPKAAGIGAGVAAVEALSSTGTNVAGSTFALRGFGPSERAMGAYLTAQGATLVAVSTDWGAIVNNDEGISPQELGSYLDGGRWLGMFPGRTGTYWLGHADQALTMPVQILGVGSRDVGPVATRGEVVAYHPSPILAEGVHTALAQDVQADVVVPTSVDALSPGAWSVLAESSFLVGLLLGSGLGAAVAQMEDAGRTPAQIEPRLEAYARDAYAQVARAAHQWRLPLYAAEWLEADRQLAEYEASPGVGSYGRDDA